MSQPKYVEYMIHELRFLSDGKEHSRKEIIEDAANKLGITPDQREETNSNGEKTYIGRGGWGLTYLNQAGLIRLVKRSIYSITEEGKKYLSKKPKSLTLKDLEAYPQFIDFKNRSSKPALISKPVSESSEEASVALTPDEQLAAAEVNIRSQVCTDLLGRVRAMSPEAFEHLVIKVLLALGYGGGNIDHAEVTGKTNDGGIDGVINEDILGLDTIYVQAKRYCAGNNVGSPEARNFVGALQGREAKGSRKGIFITASDFTKEAKEYLATLKDAKVIAINGQMLVELMYQHGVGVSESKTIHIKKVDLDFFEE